MVRKVDFQKRLQYNENGKCAYKKSMKDKVFCTPASCFLVCTGLSTFQNNLQHTPSRLFIQTEAFHGHY